MNKQKFLNLLYKNLRGLSVAERQDICAEYAEHFRMGSENGKTEAEVAMALGDPRALAREYKAIYLVDQAQNSRSASGITRAALAVIGLGFFNLIFVLGPFLALVGVLIGLFAAGTAITVSGVAVFLASFVGTLFPLNMSINVSPAVAFFTSTGLTSLGLLFLIGDWYIAKAFYGLTITYLKFNMKVAGLGGTQS